jgi:hypothetical protein
VPELEETRGAASPGQPTITRVLGQFLADQKARLSERTFAQYASVVQLLTHSLNGYAYQYLSKEESALFDRLYAAKGKDHREFCDIFGPDRIISNFGEFLNYFMVRKVMAGKDLMRAAGTVTKKLARWLAEKGYVGAEAGEAGAAEGAEAARALPKAREFADRLDEYARWQEPGELKDTVEGHFTIERVEPGRMWLEGYLGEGRFGPIALPEELTGLAAVGWRISGVVGRFRGRWRLNEVWNVYPD